MTSHYPMPETGNEEEQKEEKVKKNAPEDIYRVTNKHSALKLSRFKKTRVLLR